MTPAEWGHTGEPAKSRLAAGFSVLLGAWRRIGLLSQFMMMVMLIIWGIVWVTTFAERRIAARSMVETSLQIEQAIARSILVPLIGAEPLRMNITQMMKSEIDYAIESHLNEGYINAFKIWGVDGRLLYSSSGPLEKLSWVEPAVMRALEGETIVTLVEDESPENQSDLWIGGNVYEVYMPLKNPAGEIIAVGEIYCSVELLVGRIRSMITSIDRVRMSVLIIGLLSLTGLMLFTQRRLNQQEQALLESLKEQKSLATRNAELLKESERLRLQSSDASEHILTQIGSELHDGPIQLLSLSALYSSQIEIPKADAPKSTKAQQLTNQALTELRNISSGLILPDLQAQWIENTITMAVNAFTDETGIPVSKRLAKDTIRVQKYVHVVVYRVVYESLHNARKHSDGKALQVGSHKLDTGFRIDVINNVQDVSPTPLDDILTPERKAASHPSLGLVGMRKRASSIGGKLTSKLKGNTFEVSLVVDNLSDERRKASEERRKAKAN